MGQYIVCYDERLQEINKKLEEIIDNIPKYTKDGIPSLSENDMNMMFLADTVRELVKKVDDMQNEINEMQYKN